MLSGKAAVPLEDPILKHVRRDFPTLRQNMTIGEALASIRQQGVGEKIVYFYALDETDGLVGVIPTRRLLIAPLEKTIQDIMIRNIVTVPHTATVLQACDFFIKHRYLAMPVVDDQRHMRGIVDINLFTDEVFDMAERRKADALFESVGVRIEELRGASPAKAFRFRIPWLMATIISGTLCAMLTSAFELTLEKSIMLAFFLTLVLGLAESVSMQSMTVTIQSLTSTKPTWRWFGRAVRREMAVATMLGGACALIVSAIVLVWRGEGMAATVIGSGIFFSFLSACSLGLGVPAVLHALKLDPKIAAGPITLALTDICTLTFYFTVATMIL